MVLWVQVEEKYLALARDMMAFEKALTQGWLATAETAAKAFLAQPVLHISDTETGK